MDNVALDMSLDEDTSSMDEIPQKCPLKPQKKNKGNTFALLLRLIREKEQFVIVEGDYMMALNLLICRLSNWITVRKPRVVRPCSPITTPNLPLRKKSKEGKGKPYQLVHFSVMSQ